MSIYDAKKEWTSHYNKIEMMYPAEYVIRIFKGNYPRLNLNKNSFSGKKICDVSCGDGRNIVFFHRLRFKTYGTEITKDIVKKVQSNLLKIGVRSDIRVGTNEKIPFEDAFFDFVLSWNACYYMGKNLDFNTHVRELARILKKNGYLIMSIPKRSHVYFKGSKKMEGPYRMIRNDPLNVRIGEVMRVFSSERDIQKAFSKYFKNFIFGSDHDDCFGLDSHWHLVICQKK